MMGAAHPGVASALGYDRDRALAQYLGVGRTDLRCLDLIVRGGPQTASELGVRLHLTRGSMTTLIDRLERADGSPAPPDGAPLGRSAGAAT